MLLRRLNHKGTAGLIFRRVYDDLKRNHIDKFFEEFPQLFRFYRATDHEVILPAQEGSVPSRIVFAYAETETEIRRKFHGPEYMDMFVDQAEQLTELELKTMKTACRWPGTSRYQCKFVMFFNPGGKGISYFKRIFKDKEYQDKEWSTDYQFIQAYGWDNVEWVRSALIDDGLTAEDFYALSDQERFDYFISRSQYGQDLNALPPSMRIGHLMGSLDVFAGQFFDNWSPTEHTAPPHILAVKKWHPRWISIDWGFAHNSSVLWHCQDEQITKTYREINISGIGPRALAEQIADACQLEGEREKIDSVYLSPDAFAKRTTEDPISKQIGDVLRARGLPFPRRADDDRKSGWMLMREMLEHRRWSISSECKELIKTIPLLSRDEKDPEDCVKFEGDDAVDSARYGLKSRFPSREAPKEVQLANRMGDLRNQLVAIGTDMGSVHTSMHLAHKRFDANWAKKHRPVRLIRKWRGRA